LDYGFFISGAPSAALGFTSGVTICLVTAEAIAEINTKTAAITPVTAAYLLVGPVDPTECMGKGEQPQNKS
jgi:hypothetical protein